MEGKLVRVMSGERRRKGREKGKSVNSPFRRGPGALGVPGNGANDMPGPKPVNGTFREFLDGFVELGIPRTVVHAVSLPLVSSGSPFLFCSPHLADQS